MEYVEGKPLNGPLRVEEAVKLALQIAGALEEAHGKRILHRDLKPANILMTPKGSAKLLDFGLASLMTGADSSATQTIEGTVLGTAAYMAPEQAEGKPLDERSDVFSFGAVLYEMLSGNRAFRGNSTAAVLSAVLRDDPSPLQAPVELQRIVSKCLAKQPRNRFGSMEELRVALEQISAKSANHQPSIAVLPFANMSGDKEQEYFSDGLAEEIIHLLAQISGLKVTARTSAFAFRGKEQDVKHIAEMLGVRAILEGSVRKAGNRIRITAQLINASDGYHLWSRRFDAEMTDIFAVQDEISQAIVDTLKVHLMGAKPAARRASNIDAYHAYLKGRQHLWRIAPDQVLRAQACFEEAIALDPDYAPAYAGLAGCFVGLAMELSQRSPHELMPLARAAASKAIQLDETRPEGHFWLARVAAQYDYDWTEALRRYRLAVACGGTLTGKIEGDSGCFENREKISKWYQPVGPGTLLT
jgi:serine/threonine-protein kinase